MMNELHIDDGTCASFQLIPPINSHTNNKTDNEIVHAFSINYVKKENKVIFNKAHCLFITINNIKEKERS